VIAATAAITRPSLRGRELSYQYGLAIDEETYERGYPAGGCECDRICRCSLILHVEVENKPLNLALLAEALGPTSADERYAAQRLLAAARLEIHDFEVETAWGYYGEEVDGIFLDQNKALQVDAQWEEFLALPEDKRIPFLLEREYGHVLASLQGKTFDIEEVEIADLIFGAVHHYENLDEQTLGGYQMMSEDTRGNASERQAQAEVPLGVVAAAGRRYRVVDGYHRLKTAQDLGRESVRVYVAR
jgi:hypothetical protein